MSLETLSAGMLPGVIQEGSELTLLGLSLEGLLAWSRQQPRILGGTGRQLGPERTPGKRLKRACILDLGSPMWGAGGGA